MTYKGTIYNKLILITSIACYLSAITNTFAQTAPSQKNDVVNENDSLKKYGNQNNEIIHSTDKYYRKLRKAAHKHKVTTLIYRNFFREPVEEFLKGGLPENQVNNINKYTGKIVGSVSIKTLKPFGTEVKDTNKTPTYFIDRAGNFIHTKTRQKTIKNIVNIQEGDVFDAIKVANAERLLRQTSYLRDSRIYVVPGKTKDEVDLIIVTQDVWPIGIDMGINVIAGSPSIFPYIGYEPRIDYVTLLHSNMFGRGHQVWYQTDFQNKGFWGQKVNYTVPYIGKTLTRAEIQVVDQYNLLRYSGRLTRNFVTPLIKYAGGLAVSYNQTSYSKIDKNAPDSVFQYLNYDAWMGRSLKFLSFNESSRLIVSVRTFSNYFFSTIPIEQDSGRNFHNSYTYLGSVGFTDRRYYRDMLIYGFGRTEDIPIGKSINFTSGIEKNNGNVRPYAGIKLSQGNFYHNLGYVYWNLRMGSFFNASGENEQSVINFNLNYFSRLFSLGKYRFRQFARGDYIIGAQRRYNEYLTINEGTAINGFYNPLLRGNQRIYFNIETVMFTPWEFLGFKFVTFINADFALLAQGATTSINDSPFYQAYGVGLRVRNERLALNTFQLSFKIFQNLPTNSQFNSFFFGSISSFNLADFDINSPEIVGYR